MADTPIQPASGSLAANGIALALALSLVITPVAGSLSATATAGVVSQATSTAITPTVGSVTLAGVAPGFSKPTVTAMVPTVGAVALSGVASTLAQAIGAVSNFDSVDQGIVTWSGIANGQVGTRVPPAPAYGKVSLQVTGTFGSGGSIKLEGSNDGINWAALSPAALTGAGFFAALGANEKPRYLRPNCTAGDSTTALTVVAWFSS